MNKLFYEQQFCGLNPSELPKGHYIYLIQSIDNGGIYIGYTHFPKERWKHHCNTKKNHPLYNSMKKYGTEQHIFTVLESYLSEKEALAEETWWVSYFRGLGARVFNITNGGDFNPVPAGSKRPPEVIEKMRQALTGRKMPELARIALKTYWIGRKRGPKTPEQRLAASIARKGKPVSEQTRLNMKGKHKNAAEVIQRLMQDDNYWQARKLCYEKRKDRRDMHILTVIAEIPDNKIQHKNLQQLSKMSKDIFSHHIADMVDRGLVIKTKGPRRNVFFYSLPSNKI